jgi:hypothetical protein
VPYLATYILFLFNVMDSSIAYIHGHPVSGGVWTRNLSVITTRPLFKKIVTTKTYLKEKEIITSKLYIVQVQFDVIVQ